jgi:hypothetical protein
MCVCVCFLHGWAHGRGPATYHLHLPGAHHLLIKWFSSFVQEKESVYLVALEEIAVMPFFVCAYMSVYPSRKFLCLQGGMYVYVHSIRVSKY